MWVAVAHIFCWCGFAMLPFALPHLMQSTAGQLWVQFSFAGGAVDTFIILSGFAISYLMDHREQTYVPFITGRFFRLYPVFFLCLLFGFATTYLMQPILDSVSWHDDEYLNLYVRPNLDAALSHPWVHFFAHLTLLFGVIPEKVILPGASATLLPPAWSISLEWQYYLLAPFLARFVRHPAGLLMLGIISSGGWVYAHFWGSAFLPEKLPLFLIGIGSYHLYSHAENLKHRAYRRHIFMALIGVTLILAWHWLALLIWLAIFGSVLADSTNQNEQTLFRLRRLLLHPLLQFLGKVSYPLYLVHWPLIISLMTLLLWMQPGISSGLALTVMMMAGLPVILILAWLLHVWVEKPLMQWGKKTLEAKRRLTK